MGWAATKEEALDRVRKAIDDGLIPLLGRSIHEASSYGIKDEGHFLSCCFCCSCCCVNGRTMMKGPNVNMTQFARMEGVSINMDESKCIGCGKEVKLFKDYIIAINHYSLIQRQIVLRCLNKPD